LPKNDKFLNNKDLQHTQKGAYKPAYKKNPKTAEKACFFILLMECGLIMIATLIFSKMVILY